EPASTEGLTRPRDQIQHHALWTGICLEHDGIDERSRIEVLKPRRCLHMPEDLLDNHGPGGTVGKADEFAGFSHPIEDGLNIAIAEAGPLRIMSGADGQEIRAGKLHRLGLSLRG